MKERNQEIIKLLDYGFSQYSMVNLKLPENLPKTLKVKNGMESSVEITAINTESIPIENNSVGQISSEIILDEYIEAPIETGKKVGEIIYRQGSNILYTIDIISRNNVQHIEFKPMILKLTLNLLKL